MTATAAIRSAIEQARRDLDEIRDLVQDLLAERQEVEAAPCDVEEAQRRVESLIEGARASGVFDRHELFAGTPQPLSPYFGRTLSDNLLGGLAAVCGDALRDAFLAHHPRGGLSADQRAAKLLDLDRRLEAAQVAEEVACREIERATGGTVPCRAHAPVPVLLAFDHELEGGDFDPETEPSDDAGTTQRRK